MIKEIRIEDALFVDNDVYFFSREYNSLYCKKDNCEYAERICKVPGEPESGYRLYSTLFYNVGNIFLMPFSANCIAVYNIETGKVTEIDLDNEIKKYDIKFRASCIIDGVIYMFSLRTPSVYSFNTVDRKLKLVCKISEQEIGKYVFTSNDVYFTQRTEYANNAIYALFGNANAIFKYDLASNEYKIYPLGIEKVGYCGIAYDDNKFYIGARSLNGKSLVWHEDSGKIEYIETGKKDISEVYLEKGYPIFFSSYEVGFVKNVNDSIIMFDENKRVIRVIRDDEVVEIPTKVYITWDDILKIMNEKGSILENEIIDLNEYIDCL